MQKGDIVLVTKSVFTKDKTHRQLKEEKVEILDDTDDDFRRGIFSRPLRYIVHQKPFEGLVVGWSIRISGIHHVGIDNSGIFDGGDFEPGFIDNAVYHKVIMVQPLDTERWIKPIPCLEEDLENLSDAEEELNQLFQRQLDKS